MNLTWALSYTLVSAVTALIILLIYLHVTYDMGSEREINAFRFFLFSFILFVLSNGVCVWANYFSLRVLGTIFTTINQIAICASAYCWFCYIIIRLVPAYFEKIHIRLIMFVPMLIAILLIVSSPLTHFVFYYDENGQYNRGALYPVILVAGFLYLITATILANRGIRSAKTRTIKKHYYILMIFIVFPFLAGLIDFAYAHLPSMELVVLFGIVLIYLTLQNAQAYRDVLTGLNNRRLTDEYLLERIAYVSEEHPLFYFLSDVNQFKAINDQYGHLEGDRALQLVAGVLKRYTDIEHYYISRWGGDEFVMIVDQNAAFDPDAFIARLNADLRQETVVHALPYSIELSMGYVRCVDPDMKIDTIIQLADRHMYRKKTEMEQPVPV